MEVTRGNFAPGTGIPHLVARWPLHFAGAAFFYKLKICGNLVPNSVVFQTLGAYVSYPCICHMLVILNNISNIFTVAIIVSVYGDLCSVTVGDVIVAFCLGMSWTLHIQNSEISRLVNIMYAISAPLKSSIPSLLSLPPYSENSIETRPIHKPTMTSKCSG